MPEQKKESLMYVTLDVRPTMFSVAKDVKYYEYHLRKNNCREVSRETWNIPYIEMEAGKR